MAEPASAAAAGASLTVLAVGIFGPMAGPWALIAFAALAGAMWPLSACTTSTRMAGAWLLARCTLTAFFLTGVLATLVERHFGVPVNEGLAPVALLIGAMGNGWRPVFAALGAALAVVAGRAAGQQPAAATSEEEQK